MQPEDLLAPIDAANPAGEDARFDPEHERLRAELSKLEALSGEVVDWGEVASLAQKLLSTRSKDLLIASALSVALLETEGLQGLSNGLAVVNGLLENFAETVFPRRLRGRANAVGWLVTRLSERLHERPVAEADRAALEKLQQQIARATELTHERLADQAPSWGEVREELQRLQLSLPAAPAAAQTEAAAESASGSPTPAKSEGSPQGDAPAEGAPPAAATAQTDTSAASESDGASVGQAQEAAAAADADPQRAEVEKLVQPISEAEPCGRDLRYDDDFMVVKSEIGKLEALTGQEVDWARVSQLGGQLLQARSKDLLLACYLACAWWELERLPGLTRGLWLQFELLTRYWEPLWPTLTRPRRRANALNWLIDRVSSALPDVAIVAADREALEQLRRASEALARAVREAFEEDPPALGPLLEAISRLELSLPSAEPEPPPPAPSETPSAAATSPASPAAAPTPPEAPPAPAARFEAPAAPQGAPAQAEEVSGYLNQVGQSLLTAANVLRRGNAADPTAYRVIRIGLWLHLSAPPPSDGTGRTSIPPPDPKLREKLTQMASHGRFDALLDEAESALKGHRFWLDLQRYTHLALQGLGPAYAAAALAVRDGTASLLKRMPELVSLTFSDGAPLADAETQEFLASLAEDASGGGSRGASAVLDPSVVAALGRGETRAALASAQEVIGAASTETERFQLRLSLARACANRGLHAHALSIYESLDRQVVEHGLERWAPELAVEVLRGFLRCSLSYVKSGGLPHPNWYERRARLAQIAPAALVDETDD